MQIDHVVSPYWRSRLSICVELIEIIEKCNQFECFKIYCDLLYPYAVNDTDSHTEFNISSIFHYNFVLGFEKNDVRPFIIRFILKIKNNETKKEVNYETLLSILNKAKSIQSTNNTMQINDEQTIHMNHITTHTTDNNENNINNNINHNNMVQLIDNDDVLLHISYFLNKYDFFNLGIINRQLLFTQNLYNIKSRNSKQKKLMN